MRDAFPPSPAANTDSDSAAAATSSSRHAAAGQAIAVRGPSSSPPSNLITTMTTRRFLLLSALATLLLMPLAFAFGAAAGQAATDPVAAPKAVHFVIVVIVPALIGLLKILVPRIPKLWLPILAPLLGAAVDFLVLGSFGPSTVLGLIAGSAGVGLREILDQIGKRMTNEI